MFRVVLHFSDEVTWIPTFLYSIRLLSWEAQLIFWDTLWWRLLKTILLIGRIPLTTSPVLTPTLILRRWKYQGKPIIYFNNASLIIPSLSSIRPCKGCNHPYNSIFHPSHPSHSQLEISLDSRSNHYSSGDTVSGRVRFLNVQCVQSKGVFREVWSFKNHLWSPPK